MTKLNESFTHFKRTLRFFFWGGVSFMWKHRWFAPIAAWRVGSMMAKIEKQREDETKQAMKAELNRFFSGE